MVKAGMTRGYWQRSRRLALWFALFWCLVALAAPLTAPPFEAISVMSIPLGYYAGAQGLLIALVIAAFLFAYRQRRIDGALLNGASTLPGASAQQPPARKGGLAGMTGALAMAADWLSGAMLVALAGALYALGHDGLSWLIGLFAGIALGGSMIGPHLHRVHAGGVVDFITKRFGRFVGALALVVAAIATTLLLAANMLALVHALDVLQPGLGIATEAGVLLVAVAFAAAALRASGHGLTLVQAIAYPLILAVLSLPVLVTAAGFVPGHFTYGEVLKSIGATEFRLLEQELANPVTLKVFTRPFTTATAMSGLVLTISLALGLAAMPHVLRRPVAARSFEGARLMPAAALLLILAAALALPPLTAKARMGVLSFAGENVATLPQALLDMGARGLVEVCGTPALSEDTVAAACAATADPSPRLRLDDIVIPRDRALFVAPVLAGLPTAVASLMAVIAAVAALLAAAWLGATLAAAARSASTDAPARASRKIAAALLTAVAASAAALVVLSRTADVMTLLAWGLGISAAGLAPVLLAGIWSLRANALGAAMGMLAGVGLTLYYVIATRYFAPAFYELWPTLSSAGYGAITDFEAAKEALTAATSAADTQAARLAYNDSARAVANWWGLRDVAAGALGAAAAFAVLVVVSLLTPRPTAPQIVSLIARMRGLSPRV